MELVLVLVCVLSPIALVFVVTHLRGLTQAEVEQLARKRRDRRISAYFSFDRVEVRVDPGFKKRMKPTGKLYAVSHPLAAFPSVAAALLKYKKHEWVIVALERGKHVGFIWVNKGPDRSQVSLGLALPLMVAAAKQQGCTSVLTFHNHPNPNPGYYDCTRPSERDLTVARERAQVLNRSGLNLVAFVCERGLHYRYFLSPAERFLPLSECIVEIDRANGSSRLRNLSLHWERIF
jgi:hypothetical protein